MELEPVYETTHSVVYPAPFPYKDSHVVVSTKARVGTFVELSEVQLIDLYSTARWIGQRFKRHFNDDGVNLFINDGYDEGQKVQHLYINLVTRAEGDLPCGDSLYDRSETSAVFPPAIGKDLPDDVKQEMNTRAKALGKVLSTA